MADIREALERHGLGFLVPGSRPEQNVAAQTNSGSWWNRLLHSKQEEPLPPPPPPPQPPNPWDSFKNPETAGAFDTTRFGNRTLEDIAGTLYNENSSLRAGDPRQGFATQQQLDNGATAMAHAILNGSFKGNSPAQVAPSRVSAQIKNSALYKHYLDIARQAVSEHMHSNDPLQGRTQYNHRFNGDVGNRIVTDARGRNVRDPNQPMFQRYGPFENAAGQPAYIVIYGNGQQQQPRQQRPQQQNPGRPPSAQSVQSQQPSQ